MIEIVADKLTNLNPIRNKTGNHAPGKEVAGAETIEE